MIALGAQHHGKIFVNNMNRVMKHYRFEFLMPSQQYGWAQINPRELDVLWFYGFHALPDLLIDKFKAENPRLKVIVTWVGSDLLEFGQFVTHRPKCAKCIIQGIDMHVADGLNLVNEMEKLTGIKPVYIPSIPDQSWQLKPLPKIFSVAAYCPGFRADFFNYKLIKAAAAEMTDVEFHLFGGGPVKLEPDGYPDYLSNMTYHGWVEGEEKRKWWENSSVLLYMPIHGSLGVTAIEFLQIGRYVISNQEYPYVIECQSKEDLLNTLTGLKDVKEPHVEASKHYLTEYSAEKQGSLVRSVLDEL